MQEQDLLASVLFSVFSPGHAMFVSHQWAAMDHPDPNLDQFTVLQGALRTVWFLVGNGGMHYGDYYWGLYRGSIPPFPTKHQTEEITLGGDDHLCGYQRGDVHRAADSPTIPGVTFQASLHLVRLLRLSARLPPRSGTGHLQHPCLCRQGDFLRDPLPTRSSPRLGSCEGLSFKLP